MSDEQHGPHISMEPCKVLQSPTEPQEKTVATIMACDHLFIYLAIFYPNVYLSICPLIYLSFFTSVSTRAGMFPWRSNKVSPTQDGSGTADRFKATLVRESQEGEEAG